MIREEDAFEYHVPERQENLSIIATKPCLAQRNLSLA